MGGKWVAVSLLMVGILVWWLGGNRQFILLILDNHRFVSKGHGFACADRNVLVRLLRQQAETAGVKLLYDTDITRLSTLEADLIVIANGVSSRFRRENQAGFGGVERQGSTRYLWLGTKRQYKRFTFDVQKLEKGSAFCQAYQFNDNYSTFIAECSVDAYENEGFESLSATQTLARLEEIFSETLAGSKLEVHADVNANLNWQQFNRISCKSWFDGNKTVLLGDAAHTTHYSIGSGTKLALKDGFYLAESLCSNHTSLAERLLHYQHVRRKEINRVQKMADKSNYWFENINDYTNWRPQSFAGALLTRWNLTVESTEEKKILKLLRYAAKKEQSHNNVNSLNISPIRQADEIAVLS